MYKKDKVSLEDIDLLITDSINRTNHTSVFNTTFSEDLLETETSHLSNETIKTIIVLNI